MTTTEALDELIVLASHMPLSVEREDRYNYSHTKVKETWYNIAIHASENDCELFQGQDLDEQIQKAKEYIVSRQAKIPSLIL